MHCPACSSTHLATTFVDRRTERLGAEITRHAQNFAPLQHHPGRDDRGGWRERSAAPDFLDALPWRVRCHPPRRSDSARARCSTGAWCARAVPNARVRIVAIACLRATGPLPEIRSITEDRNDATDARLPALPGSSNCHVQPAARTTLGLVQGRARRLQSHTMSTWIMMRGSQQAVAEFVQPNVIKIADSTTSDPSLKETAPAVGGGGLNWRIIHSGLSAARRSMRSRGRRASRRGCGRIRRGTRDPDASAPSR